jgi:hypothetical protein
MMLASPNGAFRGENWILSASAGCLLLCGDLAHDQLALARKSAAFVFMAMGLATAALVWSDIVDWKVWGVTVGMYVLFFVFFVVCVDSLIQCGRGCGPKLKTRKLRVRMPTR